MGSHDGTPSYEGCEDGTPVGGLSPLPSYGAPWCVTSPVRIIRGEETIRKSLEITERDLIQGRLGCGIPVRRDVRERLDRELGVTRSMVPDISP